MYYSLLRTPINISMFFTFWKWGKICRGFICFGNFSIIAAMLSKISYFHCRNFFIHQPREKKKKGFGNITKKCPQTYATTTYQIVQHMWMIHVGRNGVWTLQIITFVLLPGYVHRCDTYTLPRGCKTRLFLRGCLSQTLANYKELTKFGGKGQVQTLPAICQSLFHVIWLWTGLSAILNKE